jgi:methyltransferase (TIGR00027 family)
MNDMQIRNVTGTAFVVAEFRAEENRAPAPLYRDAIVDLFLTDASQEAAARVAAGFPPVREMVKIRTRYFDDVLERQLSSGCRQVVLLGAGLDTRAIRKAAANVRYFEIDDGSTLSLKQDCFQRHGIRADVKFIAGNYVADGLFELLSRNDFDPDLPTYVIWEGNTMYLPVQSGKAIIEQIRDTLRNFQLSFDYFATAVITKTTGELGLTRMADGFANMGAPWVTGFDDVQGLAETLKLRLVENFTTGELYRRYRPLTVDQPIFGQFYSVCTLGSR